MVPDWCEIEYYGALTNGSTSDTDGDGLSLSEEYNGGTHPLYANTNLAGGAFWADSGSVTCNLAGYARYVIRSEPTGTVYQSAIVATGAVITTPSFSGNVSFGYWALDGARQQDAWGVARPQISFTVSTNDREAVVYLFTNDSDSDGILDRYEQYYFGTLTNNAASDTDGDGFTLVQEYASGTHPLYANSNQPGGVFWADSGSVTCNLAGYARYVIRSEPTGTVYQSAIVATGAVITTPSFSGNASFGYWALDGARQQDAWGVARPQISFTVSTNDREAVVYLFTNDSDSDGILDRYEQYYFGTLTNNAASDTDGDGFTLAQEYAGGTHPLYANSNQPGGVFWQDSAILLVDLQSFDRVEYTLIGGVLTSFFTRWPTNVTGFQVAAASAPALGDWDGDGDFDLFVGGSNGSMRIFENAGSPVIPNLVDRTTNFAVLAGMWTNTGCAAPALGDWSGDGQADLAVGGDTGVIAFAEAADSFVVPMAVTTGILDTASTRAIPAFGDLDGNDRSDLLVLLGDGTVSLYLNNGSSGIPFTAGSAAANVLATAVPDATGLAASDIDSDGDVDVLVSDNAGRIWAFTNDGANHFTLVSKVYGGSYAGFARRLTIAVADIDGDGDSDLIGGFGEGGLIYLRNPESHLLISPPSATLVAGDALVFSVHGYAGPVAWSYVTNQSGGTLQEATGAYVAGARAGVVDIVEGLTPSGLRGLAYVNVIGLDEVSRIGKAVVIAGGRSLDDPVWAATDYLGDLAFNTLLYAGFSKTNVQYLSFQPSQDVDGNGAMDDIDGFAALTNAAPTFTNWVGNANRLFIYLVDHGSDHAGEGYFRLNGLDHLTATQLDTWLDGIQNAYTTEVSVVMDFCYSGSFLDELAYTGTARRILVASASSDELTYFIAGGLVSFSEVFFGSVLQGASVEQCFLNASEAMSIYQGALLDDNGDGVYQPGIDGLYARTNTVGASFVVGRDVPQIGRVAPDQTLTTGTTAVAWAAEVASAYPVDRVWCSVVAPSHHPDTNAGIPVLDVPQADLAYNASQSRHEHTLNGLNEAGTYALVYQARDIWGGVSLPRQGHVLQSGVDERAVVVMAGLTNSARWSGLSAAAAQVYRTLLLRRIPADRIRCLSAGPGTDLDGDGTNDVQGAATLANLSAAITNWASGSGRLTVYVMGTHYGAGCRLTASETLTPGALAAWLDQYQSSNRAVNVILDHPGAGTFIPVLVPPAGRERILIASTKSGADAVFDSSGQISFTSFLMTDVLQGNSLGGAFANARRAIRLASGNVRQTPQMDDNGNGVPDEKSIDGRVAEQRYLVAAFLTGDDLPYLGARMPPAMATPGSLATIWITDVLDVDGISNVWAVVTPPGYAGTNDLPRTNLAFNAISGHYEAAWLLDQPGPYVFTFYAQDSLGQISPPVQSLLLASDPYEDDDAREAAGYLDAGETQFGHNFDSPSDEDWVRFYAVSGQVYQVDVEQQGTNVDLKLDLWWERPDGTYTNVDPDVDLEGEGIGLVESTGLSLLDNPDWGEGFYYLRVSSANTNLWGVDSDYDVVVSVPVGGGKLIVIAIDKLNPTQSPPGAVVTIDGGSPLSFNGGTSVSYADVPAGSHQVRVTTDAGYLPSQDPALPGQPDNPANALYGNPKTKAVVNNGWQSVVFQFIPHLQARGEAQDAWTGEKVAGAKIEFTARSGLISNLVYDGYPNNAAYESLWFTLADGRFPTNVLLPTVSYDLKLSKAGYSNLIQAGSIVAPVPATTNDLGLKLLTPVDANGNAIADAWEDLYFSGPTTATNDADDDGHTDLEEYWAGTNPTNAGSLFRSDELDASNSVTLRWPVSPGRIYRVLSSDSLVTGHWSPTAGPWTAAVGQATMQWTDPTPSPTGTYYGIQVHTR